MSKKQNIIKLVPIGNVEGNDKSNAIGKLVTPLPDDTTPRYICGHCDEELLSRINPIEVEEGQRFLFLCPECQGFSEYKK
jgi:hypothetical protein